MVWCLWLDRRGRGEKHCDLCGSLSLTDGIFQSSQPTTMWLTYSWAPPMGSGREEGLMALLSDSEVQSSAEVCLFHGWKPLLKMLFSSSWNSEFKENHCMWNVRDPLWKALDVTVKDPPPLPRPLTSTALPFQEHWFHFYVRVVGSLLSTKMGIP